MEASGLREGGCDRIGDGVEMIIEGFVHLLGI